MKQFFCIYRVPLATMDQWRSTTSQEEMKKQGAELGQHMMAWITKHKDSLVGQGYPLGKTKTVTKDGAKDARNDLNYAQIVQANSQEEAAALFADNPHIAMIPDSSVDVMEIPHMGM